MFTDKEHRRPFEYSDEVAGLSIGAEPADNIVPAQQVEANDKDLLLSTSEKEDARSVISNSSAYSAPLYDSSAALVASQTQPNIVSLDPSSTSLTPSASFAI